MTVTSGFYVRSLCHDLGISCGSLGLMSSLVRSRQGDYELGGENVLEYGDLEKGKEVWEGRVQGMLERFMEREGWERRRPAALLRRFAPPSGGDEAPRPAAA